MHIVFLVVGTHGDAVPVAALGRALRGRGHTVAVATSTDHRDLIEGQGLAFFPLSPSYRDEIDAARDGLGKSQAGGAGLLRTRMIAASAHWSAQVGEAAMSADLLIGAGTLMGAVASAFGQAHGVPVAHAHVMPLTPTRFYPPPLPPPGRMLPGPLNLVLFRAMRLLVWRACFADAVGMYRHALGLPPLPWRGPDAATAPHTLYNFSPHLMPPPPDWPHDRIRVTGAWSLPPAGHASFDRRLRDFIAAGTGPRDVPVHVGFGSMQVAPAQRDALARTIADALRISGRRAIVGRAWMPPADHPPLPEGRILPVDHVPFETLFGHVAACVHHGGAGTVGIAARSGIGQVIVPFVIDQFFWSWQLVRLGVSPVRLKRQALTARALADAIERAAAPPIALRAAALARAMAPEDGIATAIAALEEWGLLDAGGRTSHLHTRTT